jgi:multiple sugar transport system permease protein
MTAMCILGQLITASMVAYGFARLRSRARRALHPAPEHHHAASQVTLIPSFLIYRYLGGLTRSPLIVPDWLGGSAFTVFLLRRSSPRCRSRWMRPPRSRAAVISGIYRRIILPLIKPALAAVAIFVFMWNWNDIFYSLIYLNSEKNWTWRSA